MAAPGCGRFVKALEAVDARHAWALTPDSVLATSNGGRTWASHRPPEALAAIDFVDSHVGWALTLEGKLLATRDGGVTWRSLHEPVLLDSVCLSSSTRGSPRAVASSIRPVTPDWTWTVAHRARLSTFDSNVAPSLRCRGAGAWLMIPRRFRSGEPGIRGVLDSGRHPLAPRPWPVPEAARAEACRLRRPLLGPDSVDRFLCRLLPCMRVRHLARCSNS